MSQRWKRLQAGQADLEAAAAEAAARVRALDPALAGAPAAYIKAQVYPTLLLAMQSGEDMIAYDHGSLRQVKATIEGDRTHDGW